MDYPHLWSRLYGAPLAIHPEKAAVIEAVFRAHVTGSGLPAAGERADRPALESIAGVRFRQATGKPYALTESGIAVIGIIGTLVQRASGLDAMSGLTSYSSLGRQIDQAAVDADVRAILNEYDTYGGEAHGLGELADSIIAAREAKPVWSAINEQAYSAGYFLACCGERVTIPISGATGSIGTIALHVDQSKRDASQGYAYTYVYAGARKKDFNPHEPLSDEAHAALQAEVDRHYGLFVAHVAAMRGIDEAAVRATEAGILAPELAKQGGFVDDVATFAETIGMLQDELKRNNGFSTLGTRLAARRTSTAPKETSMADKPSTTAANALSAEQQAEQTRLIEAARSEGHAAGKAEGVKEGASGERARVKGILTHAEAKARPQLACALALESDLSAEQAGKMLAAAPKEANNGAAFHQMMAGLKNPQVGAGASDEEIQAAGQAPQIDTAAIFDMWRNPKGSGAAH